MSKKKSSKKKTGKINRIKSFLLICIIVVLLILSLSILYIFIFFPEKLDSKIKDDLIKNYSSLSYENSKNLLILKVLNEPDIKLKNKIENLIKSKYGLNTIFIKISDNSNDKEIYEIEFYRNNSKFTELGDFYIYWNNPQKIEDNNIDIIKEDYSRVTNQEIKIKSDYNHEKTINIQKKIIKIENNIYKQNEKTILKFNQNIKRENISNTPQVKINQKETPIPEKFYYISIVIDDVGYNYSSTYDLLKLGIPVTFAIIPDLPESKHFYNLILKNGYDVIIHIPMEPEEKIKFEKNAITSSMSDEELQKRIDSFLFDYPRAIGANNHMGSKSVIDKRLMNILLNSLSKKNMFWLDSMTNINTVSKEIALNYNLQIFERNVFLDNEKDYDSIKKAVETLIIEAKTKGYAVGIGHAQTKLLSPVLKEYSLKSNELSIKFVPLKSLKKQANNKSF